LALSGLVAVAIRRASPGNRQEQPSAYYCPMHPSYTSDKPGTCPICNMSLVKRESDPAAASAGQDSGRSICYLHNCPMHKDGKPCPMTVLAQPGEVVTCPVCGQYIAGKDGALKKVLFWTDPMIPNFKSDKPGKSPMGMDLVPVYAEESASTIIQPEAPDGYAPVLLTLQKQQIIGVTTAPVERRRLAKTIRAVGTVAHDPQLYQAQAEYIQAIKTLAQAKDSANESAAAQAQRMVESTRIRLRHLGLSDELIQEIAGWQEPEHSLLFSHPGDPVWMYAQVYEYELPYIRVGQSVRVEVPSLQGRTFEGTVRAIDQMVEPMTRTTRIRAQLQDPDGLLKPDMYVNASVSVDLGEVAAVPEAAVFDTGAQKIVFVDKGQGLFEPRQVTLGAQGDDFDEIKKGLAPGEVVVTSGNFLIDSESRLKSALQGIGGEGHSHGQ
jgi:RND family efflux transporter MFP subunit